MKKLLLSFMVTFILVFGLSFSAHAYESMAGPTGVLLYDSAKSYGGYTLFAPMVGCKTTYLIDMEGNMVHKWESEYTPGLFAMLLPNGNLLRGGSLGNARPATIGGASGIVQELDWSGKVV